MNKDLVKRLFFIFVVVFIGTSIFNAIIQGPKNIDVYSPSYTRFIKTLHNDGIMKVTILQLNSSVSELKVLDKMGDEYSVLAPSYDNELINDLLQHKVDISIPKPQPPSILLSIIVNSIPVLLLIAVWIYYANKQNGRFSFGKSTAKLIADENNNTSFADVAGCDEAKEEVKEVVDFLQNPDKFKKLGSRIPRGILLTGSPGCGKTLLARAIAHEAGVPFYSISGSDFVEMFVGVGASRVRNMFEEAKKNSPCIIFIDEIDAIGKSRTNSVVGNDERDQTLNALLVEMDGFDNQTGIIIIAATNRPEILDKALLRPGRFDREIHVTLPDVNGRQQILEVHSKNIPLHEDVDLSYIARGTAGFSGAELANLVNEAAIFASRDDSEVISMKHFEKAKDKILMGVEKKTLLMDDREKMMTAVHEAGHAVVGYFVPEHDPIYKVSIIPRGRALGITMFLPEKDTVSMSKRKLESQISSLYGGRIAEELYTGIFDSVTTGASNDIERATEIASRMVLEWGMSEKILPIKYIKEEQSFAPSKKLICGFSDFESNIQREIESIINRNYERSKKILKENWESVIEIADLLIEKETIEFSEIEQILKKDKYE